MIPVGADEQAALDDIRGTYKESLHYALEGAYVRILELHQQLLALENKVASLESYRDVAASTVHWTQDEAKALQTKLAELDARTVGLIK